ncbi:MAG TPA: hypothetical protein VGI15_07210 [Candidatus Cybelea sp.]
MIHYERDGIAHTYYILALSQTNAGWKTRWEAVGSKPIANLDARVPLQHPSSSNRWSQQWVKGDF